MHPAYSVELPGFRSMVSKLNPRYALPGRNYFSRTGIPILYNELREEVEQELVGEAVDSSLAPLIYGPLGHLILT